jgi:4-hydroxybenzoate polyprenyltransferase
MDARSQLKTIPLAVDLDGTLIATDLLWEGLFQLLRQQPLMLFLIPIWLLGGPARLKQEIAQRVELDAANLPYRDVLIARLRAEKEAGRKIILATGTPKRFADAVAAHLGLFDEVIATEKGENLTCVRKRQKLVNAYGDGGFDYAGNSKHDVSVFDAAREAIVVAPDRKAAHWQAKNGGELIATQPVTLRTIVKMLRVHQWLKNVLIAVPLVLSHDYLNMSMVGSVLVAFAAFSACASAIYIINDFFDLPLDRRHPTKRNRPIASGIISFPFGFFCAGLLLAIGFGLALLLPWAFVAVLGFYLASTTAYTFSVKRMLLLDVLMLAGLYTMRIVGGTAATGIAVSYWLLAFSSFFFLSLALVKRYVELRASSVEEGQRIAGRGYRPEDQDIIAQAGMASAFSAALVMALYIDSDAVRQQYNHPWMVWPLVPIALYLTMRVWILARRDHLHDDPVVFIISDWRSQIMGVVGALLLVMAMLAP